MQDMVSFHASLVVLLVDDFTGKPITGNKVRLFISGQKPPLIKPDGYYVFINLTEPKVVLHCESGLYHPLSEEISLKGMEEPFVLMLRLSPNASYPIPVGTTCVAGTAATGKRVRFQCMDRDKTYKLLYEYQRAKDNGAYISLYNPEHRELAGKAFLIQDRDKVNQEYFTITGMEEEGRCCLAEPLQHDYKKLGSVIFPVYEAFTNEAGNFFLLIGNVGLTETLWLWEIEGEREAREITLKPGQINSLIWKEEI